MLRYLCGNSTCVYAWHYTPTCPNRRRPAPRPITPGELQAFRTYLQVRDNEQARSRSIRAPLHRQLLTLAVMASIGVVLLFLLFAA